MGTIADGAVLFVVSAATGLELADGSMMPTGYWAGELLLPWQAMRAQGVRMVLAAPGGGRPQPDPASLGRDAERLRRELAAIPDLAAPQALETLAGSRPAAIVLPGGYAPMADLAGSAVLGALLRRAAADGTLVAAICHAPAALLACRDAEGWCWAGYRMAVFTDAEEDAWLGPGRLRWTAQAALTAAGAQCQPGGVWASQVVRDRNLLTGQNSPSCPAWTEALTRAVVGAGFR